MGDMVVLSFLCLFYQTSQTIHLHYQLGHPESG